MTFDQWWATLETREQHRADKALTEEAFEAGAASRDAEIAELVAALEQYVNRQSMEDLEHAGYAAESALAKVRKP